MRILHVGDDFASLRPCGLTLYSDALMHAQRVRGHEVSYVFGGRHYPWTQRPRVKGWEHRGVQMYELVGSPIHSHWEAGTRQPGLELQEPAGEAAFAAALAGARPHVVHIHELAGLPSSLIEQAKQAGLPVVMTLHDYKPVCASVRLLDADGQRCLRRDVGQDCARNCAGAPNGRAHLVEATLRYEARRLTQSRFPFATRVDYVALGRRAAKVRSAVRGLPRNGEAPGSAAAGTAPAEYQRRRDVNVRRLGLCDRLVAPSRRAAEVYAALGVDDRRLTVQRLTLPHIERLAPRRGPAVDTPLTFVTLGGCASHSKGSRAMIEAVEALERGGGRGDYRLIVLGHVEPVAAEALSRFRSVALLGPYAPDNLDHLLEPADVGILPSVWEEVHGFVGIEMLAKGLPVIANALGGIPEYVREGETGWLNPEPTGGGLAQLMARALDDRAGVERLRQSVRARRGELVRPMTAHVTEVDALYAEVTLEASARGAEPDQALAMRSPASRRKGS